MTKLENRSIEEYLLNEMTEELANLKVYDRYEMKDESRLESHIVIHRAYKKLKELGFTTKLVLEKDN